MVSDAPDRLPSCSQCRGWRKERKALVEQLDQACSLLRDVRDNVDGEPWAEVNAFLASQEAPRG